MAEKNEQKILLKLVDAFHKNLIFRIPTHSGIKKMRIRWANKIRYTEDLVKYIEKNGIKYKIKVHSIYDGLTYSNDIYEIELTKEEILKLLKTPGRKSEKYEELMKLLKECEA